MNVDISHYEVAALKAILARIGGSMCNSPRFYTESFGKKIGYNGGGDNLDCCFQDGKRTIYFKEASLEKFKELNKEKVRFDSLNLKDKFKHGGYGTEYQVIEVCGWKRGLNLNTFQSISFSDETLVELVS